MTLLTICQNVAADIGVAMPMPPIYGSSLPVNQRIYAQARRAARALARRTAWTALVTEYTFTSTGGESDYPLPDDFAWMVDDTLWERSRYWSLRGAMSPQKWQMYKSSIYGRATIWRRWRIRLASGSKSGSPTVFSVDPAIGSTDNTSHFVFEYVSRNWNWSCVAGQPETPASDFTSDNDEPLLDEWLIELDTRWRVMARLGLAFAEEQDEAEREIDKAVARDGGTAILDLVPEAMRDSFAGQYTLAAFPPAPTTLGSNTVGPAPVRRLGPPPPATPLRPAAPVPPVEPWDAPLTAPRRRRPRGEVTPPAIGATAHALPAASPTIPAGPAVPLVAVPTTVISPPPAPDVREIATTPAVSRPLLVPAALADWRPKPPAAVTRHPPSGPPVRPRPVAQGQPVWTPPASTPVRPTGEVPRVRRWVPPRAGPSAAQSVPLRPLGAPVIPVAPRPRLPTPPMSDC